MSFSPRTRYLLVTAAVLTASLIELARGIKPLVILVGALTFLVVGNLTVYLFESKERAARRQQKRDYWAG